MKSQEQLQKLRAGGVSSVYGAAELIKNIPGRLRDKAHCSMVSSVDRMEEWSESSMELENMSTACFLERNAVNVKCSLV